MLSSKRLTFLADRKLIFSCLRESLSQQLEGKKKSLVNNVAAAEVDAVAEWSEALDCKNEGENTENTTKKIYDCRGTWHLSCSTWLRAKPY